MSFVTATCIYNVENGLSRSFRRLRLPESMKIRLDQLSEMTNPIGCRFQTVSRSRGLCRDGMRRHAVFAFPFRFRDITESGRRLTRSKLLAKRPHSGGHWPGKNRITSGKTSGRLPTFSFFSLQQRKFRQKIQRQNLANFQQTFYKFSKNSATI